MNKLLARKHSDNSMIKAKTKSPMSCKENQFRYPEILRQKKELKPLHVQTNHTEMRSDLRSPSAMSNITQSPINKSVLTHRSQSMFQDAQYVDYIITNREVSQFLRKHFLHDQNKHSKLICDSWDRVPISYFMKALFQEYPEIIEDHQLNDKLMIKLRQLIKDLVSEDGQIVSLNKLQIHTKQLGLLGLLLTALREIQENKDIIQPSVDCKEQMDKLEKHQKEMMHKFEQQLESQMGKLQGKQRDLEKMQITLKQRVSENFDLFQHEAKNKAIITNLRQQLKLKEQIIQDLEMKLKQQSIDEQHPKASAIRSTSPIQSPFSDYQQFMQKFLTDVTHAWDMTSSCEDYRFSQILLAPENNQMPFQHFQLVPIIKGMPGFSEFINRAQFSMHLITNWIQNSLTSDSIPLLDFYNQIIAMIPTIKGNHQEIMLLFLKLSVCLLQIKSIFQPNKLRDWLHQFTKKQLTDQQMSFIRNLVNQLILLQQFTLKSIPQNKHWNQINTLQEYSESSKLIEHPIVNNALKKFLQSFVAKPKSLISFKLLLCLYSNDPAECIQLMQSVQAENEQDLTLSKMLLDTDVINLIIFPSMLNPKYTLKSLNCLLQFKCPGQYYILYTKQVCQQQNIELLTDLLTKIHNTDQEEMVVKIWEVLGAIAKSVCLKNCHESLQFVIRLYAKHPTVVGNIQQIQKNLQFPI